MSTPTLKALEHKYLDLTFYYGHRDWDHAIHVVTESKHPRECEALRGPHAVWHDGFNSGMLAALRLLHSRRSAQASADEFPDVGPGAPPSDAP